MRIVCCLSKSSTSEKLWGGHVRLTGLQAFNTLKKKLNQKNNNDFRRDEGGDEDWALRGVALTSEAWRPAVRWPDWGQPHYGDRRGETDRGSAAGLRVRHVEDEITGFLFFSGFLFGALSPRGF